MVVTAGISGDIAYLNIADSHPFADFPAAGLDSWRLRVERIAPSISSWKVFTFAVCAPAVP